MGNTPLMPEMEAMMRDVEEFRNSIYVPKDAWCTLKDDECHTCNSCAHWTEETVLRGRKRYDGLCAKDCLKFTKDGTPYVDPTELVPMDAWDGRDCDRWELM